MAVLTALLPCFSLEHEISSKQATHTCTDKLICNAKEGEHESEQHFKFKFL